MIEMPMAASEATGVAQKANAAAASNVYFRMFLVTCMVYPLGKLAFAALVKWSSKTANIVPHTIPDRVVRGRFTCSR